MSANDRIRTPEGVSALTSGVTLTGGAVVPVAVEHTKRMTVIKHRVNLKSPTFNVTAAVGGAADGQGQKIMTLPEGVWLVFGARYDLTVTPQAGLSGASVLYGVGTAAAGDANASLSSTEDDVIEENAVAQTITAGTAKTLQGFTGATGAVPTGTTRWIDGSAGAKDLYLNISGTWTHASVTAATMTVAGTVELFLLDLGDI